MFISVVAMGKCKQINNSNSPYVSDVIINYSWEKLHDYVDALCPTLTITMWQYFKIWVGWHKCRTILAHSLFCAGQGTRDKSSKFGMLWDSWHLAWPPFLAMKPVWTNSCYDNWKLINEWVWFEWLNVVWHELWTIACMISLLHILYKVHCASQPYCSYCMLHVLYSLEFSE